MTSALPVGARPRVPRKWNWLKTILFLWVFGFVVCTAANLAISDGRGSSADAREHRSAAQEHRSDEGGTLEESLAAFRAALDEGWAAGSESDHIALCEEYDMDPAVTWARVQAETTPQPTTEYQPTFTDFIWEHCQ